MNRVPPKLVRRLLVAPLVVGVDALVVVLSPILLLVAAVLSPLFGGRRPLRLVRIVVAFATGHLGAMLSLLGLWVRSGLGLRARTPAMQAAHYEVMRRFVEGVYDTAVRQARVEVATDETEAAFQALAAGDRPVVLLSRHAGEGDTLLVIYELLCRHGRGPRIVMHHALRVDPVIDVLGSRLPNRFVDPRGGDTEAEIAAMARELEGRSALVIFPEGTNFTEASRERGIERLERKGHARQAERAREMRTVGPPRPGGALAAIDAAPGADVVIMGHVGFPAGFAETWKRLPERQVIDVKLWHEPAETIPAGHEERIDWLYERWGVLDAWVEERRAARGS